MDDGNLLALKLDEDSMTGNVDTEMVPLDQMKMNVEEPIVVLGSEDKARQLKEEKKKENEIEDVSNEEGSEEEVKNDENPKVEVSFKEDSEEELKNDENPKVEMDFEEDIEEEVKNDENPNEEVIIEEDPEEEVKDDEDPEEEVKDDEDPEEEVKDDENPKEEMKNETINERKSEAISKNKVIKLRKRLQKKKIALRKNGRTALLSASKIFGDGEKKDHEIGEMSNEETAKEEEHNEGDARNEAKAKEKLEANSKKKENKFRKICKIKKKALRGKNEMVVKNKENPEYSKRQTTMKDKSTGMIFMCSSKTKKDCYHYQVLGLPASKRDIVFEIYEGMKLFLFDYDLKLMYGIYEAAGPGGYNIEPKAFKSAFPSQVRFTVLEDCFPLAEEKFKNVIKDNYYSKNKFHCQLNSKQVKNLCKLFSVASKGSTSKLLHGSRQAEAPTLVDYEPKRTHRSRKAEGPQAESPRARKCKRPYGRKKAETRQTEAPSFVGPESKRPRRRRNAESHQTEAPTFVGRESKRPRRSRKAEARTFVDPKPNWFGQIPRGETQEFSYGYSGHHRWQDERHHVSARDCLYSKDLVTYRRQVYESPIRHPSLGQPLRLPSGFALLPSSERDDYTRDQLQHRDLQPLDVELRRRDEFEHRYSYTTPRCRDNFDHRGSYIASSRHASYHDHDPSTTAGHQSEYYPLSSRRPASKYHLSAGPPPVYQPCRPAYRY